MAEPVLNYGFAGNSKYCSYYRPSGRIDVWGVVAALVIGVVPAVILGLAYSAEDALVQLIKFRLSMCPLYGAALGLVTGWLLQVCKVRNIPIARAVVGVVTLVSYYVSWAGWEVLVLGNQGGVPSLATLLYNPNLIFKLAAQISAAGTANTGGSAGAMNGPSSVLWMVEAACIFITSQAMAHYMISRLPFCERCHRWCSGPEIVRATAPVDQNLLKTRLEEGDFAYVSALPLPSGDRSFEFQHHRCSKCGQLNTLSVIYRATKKNKKGRTSKTKTTVIDKLLVQPDDLKKLFPAEPAVSAGTASNAITQS